MAASSAQALAGTAAPGTPELVADALAGGQERRGAAGALSLLGLAFRRNGGRSAAAQFTAAADRDAQEERAVSLGLPAAFVPGGNVDDGLATLNRYAAAVIQATSPGRSEEHTSELQS